MTLRAVAAAWDIGMAFGVVALSAIATVGVVLSWAYMAAALVAWCWGKWRK